MKKCTEGTYQKYQEYIAGERRKIYEETTKTQKSVQTAGVRSVGDYACRSVSAGSQLLWNVTDFAKGTGSSAYT